MDEIELKVHDMSSTLQPADAYALVLEEVNGNRKLPIIIGSLEAQAIKVVMMGYKMPRPLTHDLFLTVTKELGTALKKVLIYKVCLLYTSPSPRDWSLLFLSVFGKGR